MSNKQQTPDRVALAARYVADFDGTLESANKTLNELAELSRQVRTEANALQKQQEAIDSLLQYINNKRNELAHGGAGVTAVQDTRKTLSMTLGISSLKALKTQEERVEATIQAAMDLVNSGITVLTVNEVSNQILRNGMDLWVTHPASVIGTILNGDERFKRIAPGRYEFQGLVQWETL
jgi:ABC-type transporter Mla subunit MlaD